MDIFYLILLLIIIFSTKFYKKDFNDKAFNRTHTLCINGIFVVLVFLRHITDYFDVFSIPSPLYNIIDPGLEQLIVTTFLFYSGYGIMESIKNKENYINSQLPKRIKRIYLNFLLVVLTYLIVNIFLEIKYDIKTVILSLFAFETIGNSNWYIFVIVFMYLITYICFKHLKKIKISLLTSTLSIILFIILLMIFKENYWYNTAICFPLGLWFSYYKDKILKIITTNNFIYLISLIISILIFYTFYKLHYINVLYYFFWDISFLSLIILISLKFEVSSKILLFLGNYTFYIYILQRLAMIILNSFNLNIYVYIILSFTLTIVLALIYKKVFWEQLFSIKNTNKK